MSIIQKLARAVLKAAALPEGTRVTDFNFGTPYSPKINMQSLIARNTSWAYSCVRWNSNSVSMVPFRLYVAKPSSTTKTRFPTRSISREKMNFLRANSKAAQLFHGMEVEEVTEHPLIDLLQHVNPTMESFTLRKLTEQSLEVTGNGFWWKKRDALDVVEELWFLYPQFMKPVVNQSSGKLEGFIHGTNRDNSQFIPLDDLVFFRNADISSPVLGVGEMTKSLMAVDLSNSMSSHELTLISNGGAPETVMTIPSEQTVSDTEIRRMKRDYKQKYRGTGSQGRMMIVTGGAEVKPFSFSPKEMNYLGGRKTSKEEIFTVFGVPLTFADMPNVSRANGDTANTEYQRRTILPKLIETADAMNEQLVWEFDENLFIAFDNPVPEDAVFRLKERESNITVGYSTVNEERARDGLDPIDGGDIPRNPDVTASVSITEPVKRIKAFPRPAMPAANFIPEEFVEAVQKYLRSFGNAILTQANDESFKAVKVASPDDLVSRWFDFSVWDKRAENTILPFIRASILIAGPQALKLVDPDAEFDTSDPGVQKALTERSVVIRGMNRTIQKDTRAAIAMGIEAGENGSQVRKRIEGVFGIGNKNRATVIARTETIWALNEGAVQGYKQSGVVVAKEWSTAEDERVCEWCGPLDGTVIGLEGDYFKMGDKFIGRDGGTLNFPIENVGHPPLHPQCRCTVLPVVKEF